MDPSSTGAEIWWIIYCTQCGFRTKKKKKKVSKYKKNQQGGCWLLLVVDGKKIKKKGPNRDSNAGPLAYLDHCDDPRVTRSENHTSRPSGRHWFLSWHLLIHDLQQKEPSILLLRQRFTTYIDFLSRIKCWINTWCTHTTNICSWFMR